MFSTVHVLIIVRLLSRCTGKKRNFEYMYEVSSRFSVRYSPMNFELGTGNWVLGANFTCEYRNGNWGLEANSLEISTLYEQVFKRVCGDHHVCIAYVVGVTPFALPMQGGWRRLYSLCNGEGTSPRLYYISCQYNLVAFKNALKCNYILLSSCPPHLTGAYSNACTVNYMG